MKSDELFEQLIAEGWRMVDAPREEVIFVPNEPEANSLLNDIDHHPHFFVLAAIMDRQIAAERAWKIPYTISKIIGGQSFEAFRNVSLDTLINIFSGEHKLHRFNSDMAKHFHSGICRIAQEYAGDASQIWSNKPRSAAVVRRFLEFDGIGIKIATMATNILVRHFKVEMVDYSSIDISPDVQVKKFFVEHKKIRENPSREEIIYLARELCPEYPGIFDHLAWEWGRNKDRKLLVT